MKLNRVRWTLALGVLLAVLGACATVPPAQNEDRVEELIDVINELDADRMLAQSGRPFLFDSEIVPMANDVYIMWRNIYNAGFSMPNAQIESLEPVNAETYTRYGDGDEMRAYFQRALPDDAAIARIRAQHGTFELILGDQHNGMPAVYGLRGPL